MQDIMKRPAKKQSDNPANVRVSAMFTVKEKVKLEALSDALGLSMSRVLARALNLLSDHEEERLVLIAKLRALDESDQ